MMGASGKLRHARRRNNGARVPQVEIE